MSSSHRPKSPPPVSPSPEVLPPVEDEGGKKKIKRRGRFATMLAGQLNNASNTGLLSPRE